MANRRREPVSYRPFRVDPLLSEGLLAVPHEGGDLERKVAEGMFRAAGFFADRADRETERAGTLDGNEASLAGRPDIQIEGGDAPAAAGRPGRQVSGAFHSNDPVARDIPAEGRAMLNAIAGGESAGKYNIRYTPSGGALFSDLSQHPGIFEKGPHGRSSAAGRYQFTKTTWDRMGGGDFSPENQDRRGWALAQADYQARTGRPLLAELQANGLTPETVKTLAPTWQAFTGNTQSHIASYRDSLLRFTGQGAATPIQTGAANGGVDSSVQAPKITVAGGGFRPTGKDTIYGRAYDAAGTRTYLQTLNLEIEQTTDQIYEKFSQDPAKLTEAFDDLKGALRADHVFDEIAAEFELTFDRRAGRLVQRANRELERVREEENRAAFIGRTTDLETMRARSLAGLDPASPDAPMELEAINRQLDEHYDAAVAHGIMGADDAAVAKAASRRTSAVGFYASQAEGLPADAIEDLRGTFKADFAAGKLDGIDADGYAKLDQVLAQTARQAASNDRAALAALQDRANGFLTRAGAGLDIDPAEIAKFRLDATTATGGADLVTATMGMLDLAGKLRTMPLKDAEAHVRELRGQLGAKSSAADVRLVETAEKMVAEARTQLHTDPLTYGEARGIIDPTPALTEAATPEDFAGLVRQRIAAGDKVAQHFGVAARFLKAGEAKALERAIRADPESGAQIAAALVASAGDRSGAVLAEFGKAAPVISGAGAILAGGGDGAAAADVIAGAGKRPDGKAWSSRGDLKRRAAGDRHLGEAVNPAARGRVMQMSEYIARKRLFDAGIEADSAEADEIHTRALDEAAGAVFDGGVQYGGFIDHGGGWFSTSARVLVDNSIRADMFGDVLDAITDADLAGLPSPPAGSDVANRLRQATPILTSRGYVFSLGDAGGGMPLLMPDAAGEPFTLDLAGMAAMLAPRVPGAFRGY